MWEKRGSQRLGLKPWYFVCWWYVFSYPIIQCLFYWVLSLDLIVLLCILNSITVNFHKQRCSKLKSTLALSDSQTAGTTWSLARAFRTMVYTGIGGSWGLCHPLSCCPSGFCASLQQSQHISLSTKISNFHALPTWTQLRRRALFPLPPKHKNPKEVREEVTVKEGLNTTHSLSPIQKSKQQTKTLQCIENTSQASQPLKELCSP